MSLLAALPCLFVVDAVEPCAQLHEQRPGRVKRLRKLRRRHLGAATAALVGVAGLAARFYACGAAFSSMLSRRNAAVVLPGAAMATALLRPEDAVAAEGAAGAGAGADGDHVVRPKSGEALFSFDLPKGAGLMQGLFLEDTTTPNKPQYTAKYVGDDGFEVVAGPPPEKNFIRKLRASFMPSRQKLINFKLGDDEDNLEVKTKVLDDGGDMTVMHRWYRALKTNSTEKAVLIIEVPEDGVGNYKDTASKIISSFRLGA
eukprot:TRINITY_DN40798_c0_g1_i1.p1 TRINITY_DN40798_c0_g1~~TRINITY_DN40798_c0_g1_i1.p1  ORF type:complete len:258 (-),score=52.14 TRINITY_DN40798_c0_g1_i1:40-813(-)